MFMCLGITPPRTEPKFSTQIPHFAPQTRYRGKRPRWGRTAQGHPARGGGKGGGGGRRHPTGRTHLALERAHVARQEDRALEHSPKRDVGLRLVRIEPRPAVPLAGHVADDQHVEVVEVPRPGKALDEGDGGLLVHVADHGAETVGDVPRGAAVVARAIAPLPAVVGRGQDG